MLRAIEKCTISDLKDLDHPLTAHMYMRAIWGGENRDPRLVKIERNFVRLVAKAISAYKRAGEAVRRQIPAVTNQKGGQLELTIFDFTDHFEDCVISLRRVLEFVDAGNVPISRTARRSIEAYSKGATSLRNSIVHIAGAIQSDEIKDGEFLVLTLNASGEGAAFGPLEVKFADLEFVLRHLYKAAMDMQFEPMPNLKTPEQWAQESEKANETYEKAGAISEGTPPDSRSPIV